MDYDLQPTVVPIHPFDAHEDAASLRKAMKGFGTDEDAIIQVLSTRSNKQRQEISLVFKNEYGRDLVDDLKSELGGKFEDAVVAMMYPPVQFLCKQLNKAMEGVGTDEADIIEILCPRSNEEIKEIVYEYEEMYKRPLAEHLCSETGGDFRRLLTMIVTGARDPAGTTDPEKAIADAQAMFDAGEAKFGTDEEVFYRILAHASFAQLKLIFEEYKNISGMSMEQSLKHELGGELLKASLAIVECAQCAPAFFAKRLNKAMAGMGTSDNDLMRIIVSRSEIDLGNIKDEYERIYDKTLLSAVKNEISGDYKKLMCALLGGA